MDDTSRYVLELATDINKIYQRGVEAGAKNYEVERLKRRVAELEEEIKILRGQK
mgnify:FL=1